MENVFYVLHATAGFLVPYSLEAEILCHRKQVMSEALEPIENKIFA